MIGSHEGGKDGEEEKRKGGGVGAKGGLITDGVGFSFGFGTAKG